MRVISLGWGLQSFGLAAMSALGELPPVDAAIHADTTHERSQTYEFARRWTPWLEARGVRVVTVTGGRRTQPEAEPDESYVQIPAFTTWPDGKPSGMLRRQCTGDWKIDPINRWLQKHRAGAQVEQWLGITLDEVARTKHSAVKYVTLHYPFIEHFKPPMHRWQVAQWLQNNGLEIPVKSSCVFCPYHDHATWREIKISGNGDWTKAVQFDEAYRLTRAPRFIAYLHRQRIPLADVDLTNETDRGQLSLWDEECDGYCFL